MPLQQLAALSQRKRHFLQGLDAFLPREEASPAEKRLAHIRLNLPVFAMVARLPNEGERPSSRQQRGQHERSDTLQAQASVDAGKSPTGDEAADGVEAIPAPAAPSAAPAATATTDAAPKDASQKVLTAARHTYDIGYKRWEKFDVDAALREADAREPAKPARKQEVDFKAPTMPQTSDDPLETLDAAISKLRSPSPQQQHQQQQKQQHEQQPQALERPQPEPQPQPQQQQQGQEQQQEDRLNAVPAQSLIEPPPRQPQPSTPPMEPPNVVEKSTAMSAPPSASPAPGSIPIAGVGDVEHSVTASALSGNYQRWDKFGEESEELDDVDDEDYDDANMANLELDAIKGPKEEVAQIRKHWRKEFRQRTTAASKQRIKTAETTRTPHAKESLPVGPVISRPCEYRPLASAPAAEAISRDYSKWKNFDADAALLELDNEGTTAEGTAIRCSATQGSAMLNCENYTKDREEYELDQDIEKQMGGLKQRLAQRLKDAAGLKADGNAAMRAGRFEEARVLYEKGLDVMELCKQADVLMSDSLSDKQGRLIADLHRNLAQASIELRDFAGARASCDAALALSAEDEKARYRRAQAMLALGLDEDAKADIDKLAALRGNEDAAVKRLKAQLLGVLD